MGPVKYLERCAEAFRFLGVFILGIGAPFAFDFQMSPALCGVLASLCFLIGHFFKGRAGGRSEAANS